MAIIKRSKGFWLSIMLSLAVFLTFQLLINSEYLNPFTKIHYF